MPSLEGLLRAAARPLLGAMITELILKLWNGEANQKPAGLKNSKVATNFGMLLFSTVTKKGYHPLRSSRVKECLSWMSSLKNARYALEEKPY